MIFKILPKHELPRLYELLAVNIVIGPVWKGEDHSGKPLFDFKVVYDFNSLALDYAQTIHSPKRFVLPYHETMATFAVSDSGWERHEDLNVYRPLVFFGMHPCDINALNKLDLVLARSAYPNPYYIGKRKNLFIVGHSCAPSPQCFCRSVGADSALHGFDLFLHDLGDRYMVEVCTATAFDILSKLKIKDPLHRDHKEYRHAAKTRNEQFTTTVDTTDLANILDLEFDSPAWQFWGKKCLSCGTCANVCPTCYCYGVDEHVDLDLKGATKSRSLHSCNLIDFARVAGGHNFRPESATRLKYRYYHKHRGFVEAYEESLCVGCGRCGAACLAGITPPEVITSVRGKE
ncbi:MAG: 4Fe-4S dicluster domain-containing protein [Thermodesulfobacteriota bacterium]